MTYISEQTQSRPADNAPPPAPSFRRDFLRYRHFIFYPLLLLIIAGLAFWNYVTLYRVQKESRSGKEHLNEQISRAIADRSDDYLRLVAISMVWGVRGDMMKENYEAIDQYLVRFVREKNVKLVAVADDRGEILVATDKKIEGHPLKRHFPAEILRLSAPRILKLKNEEVVVAAPVMGFSAKLGTLVMLYAPEKVNLEGEGEKNAAGEKNGP